MKKFFLFSALSLLGAGAVSGQALIPLDGGEPYGGFMAQAISRNGVYVGGSSTAWMMFIDEWQKQAPLVITPDMGSDFDDFGAEIRAISNEGVGVGFDDNGPVMVNYATGEYQIIKPEGEEGSYFAIPNAITADGSIIAGVAMGAGEVPHAVYIEDGVIHYLEVPGAADLSFIPDGSRANYISADGSIIVGSLVDNFATYPMIYWTRQEDGSYELHNIAQKYFEGGAGELPFIRFNAMSLSPDGKNVVMKVQYNSNEHGLQGVNFLAMYDIAADELNVIKIDGEHGIPEETTCDVWYNGLSDTGVVVGWYESYLGRFPFIMFPDELQPVALAEAFPEIWRIAQYDENGENALSGISADGRYICGMGSTYSKKYNLYIYESYVIDREAEPEEGKVGTINYDELGTPEFFTLDGHKVDRPVKGINIMRFSNGLSKKVLVK